VGQEELQKSLPATWQVAPLPGGPLKGANFFVLFIDPLLFQDAQGKPDVGATNRYTVFAVPAKHTQTGEIATVVVTGGVASASSSVPGAYKTSVQGTVKREQTYKGANIEGGVVEDFWEARDTQGGIISYTFSTRGPSLYGLSWTKSYIRLWNRLFTESINRK